MNVEEMRRLAVKPVYGLTDLVPLVGALRAALAEIDAMHLQRHDFENYIDQLRGQLLTGFEKNLAARLLRMASDSFGNHGCNDYELESTDEAIALVVAAGDEVAGGAASIWTQDWLLMSHLANRLDGKV